MMAREGRVTFSELHNSPFTQGEKAFLGRLYEIFFQIPAFLGREYRNTGKIPTLLQVAKNFEISRDAVDLLLAVMASDPRVPPLFTQNPRSREIESLNRENLDAFLRAHGSPVQVTGWVGRPLPSFDLATFEGERISASDLAGSHVLIYFWFTGCPPCEKIAPLLADLNRHYASSEFRVVGLNADNVLGLTTSREDRESHLRKRGVNFTNAHLDRATQEAFGTINVFPTLFLVQPDGTIFQHLINYQNRERLESAVGELIRSSGDERQERLN